MAVYRQGSAHLTSQGRAHVPLWTIPRSLAREVLLWWAFSKGDLTATIVPATTFAFAAWGSADLPTPSLPMLLAECLVYFWLYIYTFNLSNQLIGIEEDRINKPHRPLVTGVATVRGAWLRLFITTAGFLALGAVLGVLAWTVLWVAAWTFHNHLGGARTAGGKNVAMVAGTIAQIAAAWQIVTPLSATALTWILAIALPLGLLVSLQDLRDLDGDLAVGRRTAVVAMGEKNARLVFCLSFAVYPVGLYFLLYRDAPSTGQIVAGIATTLAWAISYRVVRLRERRSDHTTYMMYTYWYCATLASAIFCLAA